MIIKFSLARLLFISFLAVFFPLIQKQWLNLSLFNINNFSIYRLLYYSSGLIIPILIIINSLSKFTYYKFNYPKRTNSNDINGKYLFLITLIVSSIFSILVTYYIFINLKLILDLFMSNNEYLVQFDIDIQILFVVIISTFLIFKKTKIIIKKFILINFFIFSIITWYLQINNSLFYDILPFFIFKFQNISSFNLYFMNITLLLAIETLFYLWSYISYRTHLSDWNVPKPYKNEVVSIFNIFLFYFFIIFYYSILLR